MGSLLGGANQDRRACPSFWNRQTRAHRGGRILLSPSEHLGKVYPLYGPREYTFAKIAAEIGKAIGKPLAYHQITAWDLKNRSKGIATRSSNEKRADNTLWQQFEEIAKDHQNGVFFGTDKTVERLTGQAPMGLPEFLQAHRAELTAG